MNIVMLIAITLLIATLSVAHGNNQPCKPNPDNGAHKRFVQRHIVKEIFDRKSRDHWERYIWKHGLNSRPWQSFIEDKDAHYVENICNGGGFPILPPQQGNLCMNSIKLLVHDLTVNRGRVTSLKTNKTYVIVACDMVGYQCLPVHFERYNWQKPNQKAGPCKL